MRFGNFTALLCIFLLKYVLHISTQVIAPGYLDFDNLPDTNFSCEGKVIGGYYADIETGCQMFHVCTIGQKGEITDIKFLCLNGTVFDQETRVCERVDEVDCSKTEGFYDLNLELYGNNAALSFPEEEDEADSDQADESQENAETSDRSPQNQSLKHKISTPKPLTTLSPSSTSLTPHPASTTTSRPIHPYIPTTTVSSYKPNQHQSHFHSTTSPSISAFLAINNAFSNSNQGKHSSQYDDDEDEEDEESITEQILQHHFPVTTISTQVHHGAVSQPKVKIQGTGESGLLRNQQNTPKHLYPTPKSDLIPPTSTQSSHIYSHSYHQDDIKDPSAHSKHHHNTQLILNQQRSSENKQHHGFKPIANPENRSQFLYSSSTQQPPIYFTTKNPPAFSTTVHSSTLEPFSIHAIGPQPPQQTVNNPSYLPQTNAHQVPSASAANSGGFLAQNAQASQSPLSFQFSAKSNNRQGHQLLTTPSIAVIATTSSTSSSSSVKAGSARKNLSISPEISLTSFIGNTDKRTGSQKNSSLPVQLLSETSSSGSYEEYQEADVAADPFFEDVPRLSKSVSSSTSTVVHRKKRSVVKQIKRSKRKASPQLGLPTEIFDTGTNRARGGTSRDFHQESQRQRTLRYRARLESTSTLPKLLTGIPERNVPTVTEFPEPETFRVSPEASHVSSPPHARLEPTVQANNDHNPRRTVVRVRGRKPVHRTDERDGSADITNTRGRTSLLAGESTEVPHTSARFTAVQRTRQDLAEKQEVAPGHENRQRGQARATSSHDHRKDHSLVPESRQNNNSNTPRRRVVHRYRNGGNRRTTETSSGDNSAKEPSTNNGTNDMVVEQPPPTTPLPETNFTCDDKIPGGYYADLEADCQLFHICSQGRHGKITDNKFLCGPGTRFNQRSRTCQARELVDCHISASLYYLNSHFKVEYPESSKVELAFEPKKIQRVKRKAAKAPSEPEYSVDNIPETSFTCSNKGKEGLYADVETHCKVFHLCRIISGHLTLESSFVCPPGTVFNQPEGSCDTTKEVDCELYSAPEHAFRKTPSSGNKNKSRNRRHSSQINEKISTNFKHFRAKRNSTGSRDKVDYYDYVDDNYEAYIAHTANPVDDTLHTKDNNTLGNGVNNTDVYDYIYDDYDYEIENDTKQDSTEIPQSVGKEESDIPSTTEALENVTQSFHQVNSTVSIEFDHTTFLPEDTQETVNQESSGVVVDNSYSNTDIPSLKEININETLTHKTMSDKEQLPNADKHQKGTHQNDTSTKENTFKIETNYYKDSISSADGSIKEDDEYYEYDYEEYDDDYPANDTETSSTDNGRNLTEHVIENTTNHSIQNVAVTESSTLEPVTTEDSKYSSRPTEEREILEDEEVDGAPVEDSYTTKYPDFNEKEEHSVESETGANNFQQDILVSSNDTHTTEDKDHRYSTSSMAPEIPTTIPSIKKEFKDKEFSLLPSPIEEEEEIDYETDDETETTHEIALNDITTTAETLNEITPSITQESRVTRHDDYSNEAVHLEDFVGKQDASVSTTSTPKPTTSTIPSLFRPIKSHTVFRNRFAVPEPPAVSIRPAGQSSANRRNIQRGSARQRNTLNSKDRTKKPNRFHDLLQDISSATKTDTEAEAVTLMVHKASTDASTLPSAERKTSHVNEFNTEPPSLTLKSPMKNANAIAKTDYAKYEPHDTTPFYDVEYSTHNLPFSPASQENGQMEANVEQITTQKTQSHISQSKNKNSSLGFESTTASSNVFEEPNDFKIDSHKIPVSDVTMQLPHGADMGYTPSSVPKDFREHTSFVCTGKEMHQYHPDPEDCRMFHYCSPGFHSHQFLDFRFKCENGTVFEAESQKCVSEHLVPNCFVSTDHKRDLSR